MAVDVFRAAAPAVLATCTGIAFAYFVYRQFIDKWYGASKKFSTVAKIQYWLGVASCLFIAQGLMTISGEFFYIAFNESHIRWENVYRGVHVALDLPALLMLTSFVISKFSKSSNNSGSINDEKFYEIAFNELAENKIRTGLWAKCLSLSNGDESKAKSEYIKTRVMELSTLQAQPLQGEKTIDKRIFMKITLLIVFLIAGFFTFKQLTGLKEKGFSVYNCSLCTINGNCEIQNNYNFIKINPSTEQFELFLSSDSTKNFSEKTMGEETSCKFTNQNYSFNCKNISIGSMSTETNDVAFDGYEFLTKKNVVTLRNGEKVLSNELTCKIL